ncbi:hypothetical protein H696_00249 [Fonticula alba]|uniref:RBR-type E3 ubiquitin transferase n=1 Tax=Fonticula alba TaxID=691883 RepID=A0A058ZE74_FONAL|nr:hypothetical protein H696_00249 [Fonticula alba]KCV72669.1 hypothetical protein H696_00249 [Fonticula alba]|eukprot:XP_009492370.1 hypothetical protein H696_00249 [Fonticula alba]
MEDSFDVLSFDDEYSHLYQEPLATDEYAQEETPLDPIDGDSCTDLYDLQSRGDTLAGYPGLGSAGGTDAPAERKFYPRHKPTSKGYSRPPSTTSPAPPPGAPPRVVTVDFKCLSPSNLAEMVRADTLALSSTLAIDEDIALLLLLCTPNATWQRDKILEKYFDSSESLVKQLNLDTADTLPEIEYFNSPSNPNEQLCDICADYPSGPFLKMMPCQHTYCLNNCWKAYLRGHISSGLAVISCMACSHKMSASTIRLICDAEDWENYVHNMVRTYLIANRRTIRPCPTPDCTQVFRWSLASNNLEMDSSVPIVACNRCHKSMCFYCSIEGDHRPTPCILAQKWKDQYQEDSGSALWIATNTRECPKCHASIEKFGGCNHISCKSCHHDFCWVCFMPWSLHSHAYACNRYNGLDAGNKNSQSRSRVALDRYVHYFTRYSNHRNSARMERKTAFSYVHTRMARLQARADYTWIEVQFLLDAAHMLLSCRDTLAWSYAFAHYLDPQSNYTLIFESNQRDLEYAVESLSRLLEYRDATAYEMPVGVGSGGGGSSSSSSSGSNSTSGVLSGGGNASGGGSLPRGNPRPGAPTSDKETKANGGLESATPSAMSPGLKTGNSDTLMPTAEEANPPAGHAAGVQKPSARDSDLPSGTSHPGKAAAPEQDHPVEGPSSNRHARTNSTSSRVLEMRAQPSPRLLAVGSGHHMPHGLGGGPVPGQTDSGDPCDGTLGGSDSSDSGWGTGPANPTSRADASSVSPSQLMAAYKSDLQRDLQKKSAQTLSNSLTPGGAAYSPASSSSGPTTSTSVASSLASLTSFRSVTDAGLGASSGPHSASASSETISLPGNGLAGGVANSGSGSGVNISTGGDVLNVGLAAVADGLSSMGAVIPVANAAGMAAGTTTVTAAAAVRAMKSSASSDVLDADGRFSQYSHLLNSGSASFEEDFSDVGYMRRLRQMVIDRTMFVKSRRAILLEDVASGLAENRWVFLDESELVEGVSPGHLGT